MNDNIDEEAAVREAAFARRKVEHAGAGAGAATHLAAVLSRHKGLPISGYLPIRTEIDPLPAMAQAAALKLHHPMTLDQKVKLVMSLPIPAKCGEASNIVSNGA